MSVALIFDEKVKAARQHDSFERMRERLKSQQRTMGDVTKTNNDNQERFETNNLEHGYALDLAKEQNIPVHRDGSVTLRGLFGPRTFSPARREAVKTAYDQKFFNELMSEEGFIVAHMHSAFGDRTPQALEEFYGDLPSLLTTTDYQRAENIRASVGKHSYSVVSREGWTPVSELVDTRLPAASLVAKIKNPGVIDKQITIINRMEKHGLMCDMSVTQKWMSKLGL